MSDITTSDDKRWKWIATVVTILLHITLYVLLIGAALGILSLSSITQGWFILFSSILLTSTVWLYGEDAYRRFNKS